VVAPHLKFVNDAQIGGKLAHDVIDHVPKVQGNDKSKKFIKREDVTSPMKIEFKGVNFTYPSRKDLPVLKDFNCVFEAGKTTALVGPSGSGKSTVIQLLERFYDPTEGQVLIDDLD